uniref:MCS protein n=1 Tax=unidentified baculovirus TaxID=10469 RepID=Q65825_9BACU|nr:MCS [unidentified baculovirus]
MRLLAKIICLMLWAICVALQAAAPEFPGDDDDKHHHHHHHHSGS